MFGDASPYFYTASLEEPLITRWELTATGEFGKGPTVSFANQGINGTYAAALTPLYSRTKAYFADEVSGQIMVWNPTDMTFLRAIPIDVALGTDPPRSDLAPSMGLAVREDRILVSVFWASQDSGWTENGGKSRLLAIDPDTDEVVEVEDETRCETLSPAGVTSDGTAYFTPGTTTRWCVWRQPRVHGNHVDRARRRRNPGPSHRAPRLERERHSGALTRLEATRDPQRGDVSPMTERPTPYRCRSDNAGVAAAEASPQDASTSVRTSFKRA